jgi:ATP-dependent Zn protease
VKRPTRKRTAWHEAGHAVVAWERGLSPTLVSIRAQDESFGRSQHTPAGDCSILEDRTRESIVAMAGWAAELASGEADDGVTYDSSDLSWVLNRIDEHAPSQVDVELGWAESEAVRIVSSNLERVRRLADELTKREEIAGTAEIVEIIKGDVSPT